MQPEWKKPVLTSCLSLAFLFFGLFVEDTMFTPGDERWLILSALSMVPVLWMYRKEWVTWLYRRVSTRPSADGVKPIEVCPSCGARDMRLKATRGPRPVGGIPHLQRMYVCRQCNHHEPQFIKI